ncbi:tyrosine-type recombinase/integrase [Methylocapsa aurea]|uniref:tyrosine-type recombinase/integrase n=1 Tax=Methylocapsa aurea TaxID=663610 RepID=UPI00056A94E2|nr:site-specific integrase [Methylocapsa aurea]
MAKLHRLTARFCASVTKPGRHADGGNLYLRVDASGAASWVFMWARGGRQREAGLGSRDIVSLAQARELAGRMRESLVKGIDPLDARAAERRANAARLTFGECADTFVASKESGWRNEKHRAQWKMTLQRYAATLRPIAVADVSTQDILKALQPIWRTKPETASRLRGRIEAVIDSARVAGQIDDRAPNPARWTGHLEMMLPRPAKLSRGHHAAMPYRDLPTFLTRLRETEGMGALALEFAILTAARSGEVLGARWSEIDVDAKIWTVPAARMKAAREHRVPLPSQALTIIEKLSEARMGEFVFAGQRRGKPLSNMAMEMTLRRMKVEGVTVHGFRSAFRDWAGEETHFPRELAEAALAHVIGDKAEQAYRRGDALEKRRALMEEWAAFCEGMERRDDRR